MDAEEAQLQQAEEQPQEEEVAAVALADVTVVTPLGKQVHLPPVAGTDMVSAIKQYLAEIAETCSFTAYHLLWEGGNGEEPVQLNDFVEIMAYPFTAEPCTLKMVLEDYDARGAKIHLRRFRELLHFPPVDKNLLDEREKAAAEEKAAEDTAAAEPTEEAAGDDEVKEGEEQSIEEQQKQWMKMLEERAAINEKLRKALPEQDVELTVSLADLADFTLDRVVDAPTAEFKPVKCLEGVVLSAWNPPPATRAMQGDLMYLEVHTVDDGVLHVTCTRSGFYINNTSHNGFDPRPATNPHFSHELLYTLLSASPSFFAAWNTAVERVTKIHSLSENPLVSISANLSANRVSSIFVKPQWVLPANYGAVKNHQADPSRAEASFLDSFGLDDRGALREWNDEIQGLHELSPTSTHEKIMKERFIYKTYVEFTDACEQAAVAIVDGHITPMNPQDNEKSHVYIFNNIFFSKCADTHDNLKEYKGDDAARKSMNYDLVNQKLIQALGIDGLHIVMTTIVDYKGQRIIGQSILPGILYQGKQGARLVYGGLDTEAAIKSKTPFHDLMKELGKRLNIAERMVNVLPFKKDGGEAEPAENGPVHTAPGVDPSRHGMLTPEQEAPQTLVVDDVDDIPAVDGKVPFIGPIECKGLQGSDGRMYLLEVTRLAPRDANFIPASEGGTGVFTDEEIAAFDEGMLPIYSLRPELVTRWARAKIDMFRRQKLNEMGFFNEDDEGSDKKSDDDEQAAQDGKTEEEKQAEAQQAELEKEAARQERLQKMLEELAPQEEEYLTSLALNPNSFTGFDTKQDEAEKKADQDLARDAAIFLSRDSLVALNNDVRLRNLAPVDGAQLTEMLHSRGINLRYLGKLASMAQDEERQDAELTTKSLERRYKMPIYWLPLLEVELFARASKHTFNRVLPQLLADGYALADIISAFLNTLVSGSPAVDATNLLEGGAQNGKQSSKGPAKKGSKNNKNKKSTTAAQLSSMTSNTVPAPRMPSFTTLLDDVMGEMKRRFGYTPVLVASTAAASARARVDTLALLRRVCQQCGIQIVSRRYDFRQSSVFTRDDIVGVFPRVKSSVPTIPCVPARELLETARTAIDQRNLRTAFIACQEALSVIQEVCGTLHSDVADAMEAMAVVLHQAEDSEAASEMLYKSLAVQIQLTGLDSHQTISAHEKLALMLHSNSKTDLAVRHMMAAIFLREMAAGSKHPGIFEAYQQVASMYRDIAHPNMMLRCLQHCLVTFPDTDKLTLSRLYHSMAEGLVQRGDFRTAVTCEKQAYNVSRSILGEDNPHTVMLRDVMEQYTKAAVEQAVQMRQQQDQVSWTEPIAGIEVERKSGSSAAKKKNKKGKKK